QSLRLVNVSKFEIRISLRPPSRRELDVVLCGPRGLAVSSGAAAELRVRFKPRDVRAMRDALLVRVSMGKDLTVPIYCYMQPPIVNVLVPHMSWSSLSSAQASVRGGGDVLELGARLLGDVHSARLLLHCEAQHAAFFVLTEDAWISFCLDTLTRDGAVIAGPFTIKPAWWRGGGAVRGSAWCRAPHAGLHAAALRVLASTAVTRPLHLLADALHFSPNHITLEAQDKDYDICSEDDPACEYYVHLGTAFPNRSLSATVQLVNHSPVIYSYYWSVRPWGVCSCWEEELAAEGSPDLEDDSERLSERLCVGALDARARQETKSCTAASNANLLRVEPTKGRVAPRFACPVHVCVPGVGTRLGTQRAVLMLILKDIPKESFPPDYDPMIVKTETVMAETIPGQEPWSREVCEVVCAQLEVWWEVVPVRFVLDPPILPLPHSRRVKEVELMVRATQMYGSEGVLTQWCLPARMPVPPAPAPRLSPAQSAPARLSVPLPSLPNEHPETDVFVLEAANGEWESQSTMIRQCATRHPRLIPARVWLGVVSPGAHMHTQLEVFNDTHQHICWWGTPFRWHGENEPSKLCGGREPCTECKERACTCALLRPTRGALAHLKGTQMVYDVNAPDNDGCVATLLQVRRTLGDVARVPSGAGCEARASLVAYRVLAPRLVVRALPCHGDKVPGECEGCSLDTGEQKCKGTAVLRPSAALALGRCTCYRLRITNITPLPTTVKWEGPMDKEENIKVIFIPNDFDVGSYGQVEIRLVIETRKVCGRKIFVYRARVARAYKPLYLLIDTAVAGLEILCEMPIGGEEQTSATVIMRRTQSNNSPNRLSPSLQQVDWDKVDVYLPLESKAMRRGCIAQCPCRSGGSGDTPQSSRARSWQDRPRSSLPGRLPRWCNGHRCCWPGAPCMNTKFLLILDKVNEVNFAVYAYSPSYPYYPQYICSEKCIFEVWMYRFSSIFFVFVVHTYVRHRYQLPFVIHLQITRLNGKLVNNAQYFTTYDSYLKKKIFFQYKTAFYTSCSFNYVPNTLLNLHLICLTQFKLSRIKIILKYSNFQLRIFHYLLNFASNTGNGSIYTSCSYYCSSCTMTSLPNFSSAFYAVEPASFHQMFGSTPEHSNKYLTIAFIMLLFSKKTLQQKNYKLATGSGGTRTPTARGFARVDYYLCAKFYPYPFSNFCVKEEQRSIHPLNFLFYYSS
ncbi:hypothetical protein ABMA28_017163, partial [Loxostege sticticalis]